MTRACGGDHDGPCGAELLQQGVAGICDDCGRLVRTERQPQPAYVTGKPGDGIAGLLQAIMAQAEQALVARCRTCGQHR